VGSWTAPRTGVRGWLLRPVYTCHPRRCMSLYGAYLVKCYLKGSHLLKMVNTKKGSLKATFLWKEAQCGWGEVGLPPRDPSTTHMWVIRNSQYANFRKNSDV